MIRIFSLAALAVLAAPVAGHAAFVPGATPAGLISVPFGGAVGTTYATYTSTVGGQTVTVSSLGNLIERDDTNSLLDNNFASNTNFVAQCGYAGLGSCFPSFLTIAFSQPIGGFSLSADDFDTLDTYNFRVLALNGQASVGLVTASSLADNGQTPAVLSATSTTPITTLELFSSPAAAGVANDYDFVVANLGFAPPVPEPATLALLGSAVFGLAAAVRRRAAN